MTPRWLAHPIPSVPTPHLAPALRHNDLYTPGAAAAGMPSQEEASTGEIRPQPDQPLLVNNQPNEAVEDSGREPQPGQEPSSSSASWKASLASTFAGLRRALSRGGRPAGSEQLPGSDAEAEASSSGSGAGPPGGSPEAGDVEQGAAPGPEDSDSAAASRANSGEISGAKPGSPKFGRQGSGSRQKTCLICLEELTDEDFESGRAISLQCNCRGDLALRHKECAIKWAQVKGDLTCELCKAQVRNLPALPPRPPPEAPEDPYDTQVLDLTPSYADLVFDCIRVTWVAMIVSILFFEMNLGAALWTGLIAGFAYSVMVRLMYRQHFAAMQRLAEAQAAQRAGLQGGGQPQVQVVIAPAV